MPPHPSRCSRPWPSPGPACPALPAFRTLGFRTARPSASTSASNGQFLTGRNLPCSSPAPRVYPRGLPPGPLQQGAPLCIGMQRQPGSTLLSFTNLMWLQVQSSASQAEDKLPTPPPKKKKLDVTFRDLTPCAEHSHILGAAKMSKILSLGCFARPRVRWLTALRAAHHPRGTGLQSRGLLHRKDVAATWNLSRNE